MPLVLIGGAQRSGTTLVQMLIANALSAPILPEAHILCDLFHAHDRAVREAQKTSRYYDDIGLRDFFRAIVSHHLEDIAGRYGTDALVLKDPHFAKVHNSIRAIWPDALLIITVRDPRDIAASFIGIGEREIAKERTSRYTKRDIQFICQKTNDSYRDLSGLEDDPLTAIVKYERAVIAPVVTLDILADRFGLELDSTRVADPEWLNAEALHQEAWRTPLDGQPPRADSVGSFAWLLTADEIKIVEAQCGTLMSRFGYDR